MNVMLNKLRGKVEILKLQNVRQSTIHLFFMLFFLSTGFFRQKVQNSIERTPPYSGHFFLEP